MGVQPIPVKMEEPLPPGCVGLLLGRGSLTRQGLLVHPGLIDNQHTLDIQALCSCPSGVFSINPGDRIAQLLMLPACADQAKKDQPMGSTGQDSAYLMVDLRRRPTLPLWINNKKMEGVLDTGADLSIISSHWWPKNWPTSQSTHSLQGLGYASNPMVSSTALHWKAEGGRDGWFTPYILPLPVNLWGRDIMQDLGLVLSNEYSPQAQQIMSQMGYEEGKGLGRNGQGRLLPIQPSPHKERRGLGFS